MLRVIYESAKKCFIALGRETTITMTDQNAQNAAILIEAGPPDNVRLPRRQPGTDMCATSVFAVMKCMLMMAVSIIQQ